MSIDHFLKTTRPGDLVREVTHPWFPLEPGSVWRYKGLKEGATTIDVVTATHRTKKIPGVTTTVVHDVVSAKGKLEEVADDFYAQDRKGGRCERESGPRSSRPARTTSATCAGSAPFARSPSKARSRS